MCFNNDDAPPVDDAPPFDDAPPVDSGSESEEDESEEEESKVLTVWGLKPGDQLNPVTLEKSLEKFEESIRNATDHVRDGFDRNRFHLLEYIEEIYDVFYEIDKWWKKVGESKGFSLRSPATMQELTFDELQKFALDLLEREAVLYCNSLYIFLDPFPLSPAREKRFEKLRLAINHYGLQLGPATYYSSSESDYESDDTTDDETDDEDVAAAEDDNDDAVVDEDDDAAAAAEDEAIDNLKASAAAIQRGSKPAETQPTKFEALAKSSKSQTSSGLPPNFEPARADVESAKSKNEQQSKQTIGSELKKTKGSLPDGFFDNQKIDSSNTKTTSEPKQSQTQTTGGSETKPVVKGALPTGFFDNKEADLLARGIKLVKPDIKDEYKEFEKLIQEDLQVVDSRMEEEEVDAAETIEEEEQREQRSYKEKVEILKRKKMELKAARLAKRSKTSEGSVKKSKKTEEESPSDEEDDEDSAVDWRAQHL